MQSTPPVATRSVAGARPARFFDFAPCLFGTQIRLARHNQRTWFWPSRAGACLRTKLLHLSRHDLDLIVLPHDYNLHGMLHFLDVSVWHLLAFIGVGKVLVLIGSVLILFLVDVEHTCPFARKEASTVHCMQG